MRGSKRHGISGVAKRGSVCVLLGSAAMAVMGCNVITGVSNLAVTGDDLGKGGSGSGSGTASGDPTGGGGAGGKGPTQCVYPMAATYSTHSVGDTVPETLNWQGFVEGATEASTIKVSDLYDCDGTRNINAILLDESATWCGACQTGAQALNGEMTKWAPMGIKVVTLMIEDLTQGVPATLKTAQDWKAQFKLDTSTVAADPGFEFTPAGESTIGLPVEIIVDPRTMQIIDMQMGYSGDYTKLEALANKNAGGGGV